MTTSLQQKLLTVKKSPIHGVGVFALGDIPADEIIEECRTLLTDHSDPALMDYYFSAEEKSAIALGFGSLYNHAEQPNAAYEFNSERQVMIFKSKRRIRKGEEIFISYGKSWFDTRPTPVKHPSWLRRSWIYFRGIPLRSLITIGCLFGIIKFIHLAAQFTIT